jgi:hypothetical protein
MIEENKTLTALIVVAIRAVSLNNILYLGALSKFRSTMHDDDDDDKDDSEFTCTELGKCFVTHSAYDFIAKIT